MTKTYPGSATGFDVERAKQSNKIYSKMTRKSSRDYRYLNVGNSFLMWVAVKKIELLDRPTPDQELRTSPVKYMNCFEPNSKPTKLSTCLKL